MPIFLFKGRILPEISDLNLWNIPTVHFSEAPHAPDIPDGLTFDITIAINNSNIDLVCDVEQRGISIARIHNRAISYVRALVDLQSFATGAPLFVMLDTVIGADGIAQSLRTVNRALGNICTVGTRDSKDPILRGFEAAVLDTVIREPALFLALRDLISAISYSGDLAVIDCARAVEGLRAAMFPGERKDAWGPFQENLNIDRPYREYVTKLSTGPRHGDRTQWITGPEVDEAISRSWKIMNRFLEFRKNRSQRLPEPDFPMLTG